MPLARLAYRTIGSLNAAKDNAILVPSWYTGTDADSELCMCGAHRALNPDKYFIILTNLLANGISSSPSNTPAPFEKGRFPKITLFDNVVLQHKLVTERLGLQLLRLVTGWSMGACQTYQWAAQFPDMAQAAPPIAGSARTASALDVFGLHRSAPASRYDCMGVIALMEGNEVTNVTPILAEIRARSGHELVYLWRANAEAVAAWE